MDTESTVKTVIICRFNRILFFATFEEYYFKILVEIINPFLNIYKA